MAVQGFQLAEHPWLSLAIVMLAVVVGQVLVRIVVIGLLKRPSDAPLTQFAASLLGHAIVLFFLVPFVLKLPDGTRSFSTYLDAIRLSRVQPFFRLLLLGLSCSVIIALCQACSTLVYRALEGKAVTWPFVRGMLGLSGELPPESRRWLILLPSALEEVAFRGVILSVFMLKYPEKPAILFTALGFGAIHLFNLANGRELVWVLGQVVWAAILGLFYGVVVLKSNSLWPAMVVHYMGNLFVWPLTSNVQQPASAKVQAVYGIVFSGLVPTALMILWVLLFTALWPIAG